MPTHAVVNPAFTTGGNGSTTEHTEYTERARNAGGCTLLSSRFCKLMGVSENVRGMLRALRVLRGEISNVVSC